MHCIGFGVFNIFLAHQHGQRVHQRPSLSGLKRKRVMRSKTADCPVLHVWLVYPEAKDHGVAYSCSACIFVFLRCITIWFGRLVGGAFSGIVDPVYMYSTLLFASAASLCCIACAFSAASFFGLLLPWDREKNYGDLESCNVSCAVGDPSVQYSGPQ
jgi:hypothetical protein